MKAGYLLAVEGCLPIALGARVRLSNGKVNVTDGPFTEAKEVIGGFALFQVNSKAEADRARQAIPSGRRRRRVRATPTIRGGPADAGAERRVAAGLAAHWGSLCGLARLD